MPLKGLANVTKNLRKVVTDADRAVGLAIRAEAFGIMAESIPQVPVLTGRLRASGTTGRVKITASGPQVRIGYGTDYGLAVHEKMEVHHPVGNAKFLERPVNAAKRGYAARVARRAKRLAGGKL